MVTADDVGKPVWYVNPFEDDYSKMDALHTVGVDTAEVRNGNLIIHVRYKDHLYTNEKDAIAVVVDRLDAQIDYARREQRKLLDRLGELSAEEAAAAAPRDLSKT